MDEDTKILIDVLQKIYTDDEDFYEIFNILQDYKFVKNIRTLKPGIFVRYIDLRNVTTNISKGGFYIKSYKMTNLPSKYIMLKGINNKPFSINSDFCVFFIRD